ncbi:MAG TPA: ankyrin repeat domain-containing protein, partial [Bdellovibrionales bacterium]|nr:ankyrin repeat domain-containing protein [Bdellovibrionales bacterium]
MTILKVLTSALIIVGAAACTAATANESIVDLIASGQMDKVKALTKKGVSIDTLSNDQTGLMKVAEDGDKTTTEQLLKLGADVNKTNSKNETAVWFATYGGHEDLALALLDKGAKADQVNKDTKECLLHAATKSQLTKLTARLKKLSPQCLSVKNIDGQTP